jgi:hypothetical protein
VGDPTASVPIVSAVGISNIEEHGFPIALKIDVERIDDRAVPFRPRRYQRFAPLGLLDNVQDRIVGIRASSSPKYMRVARPILMPREASQKLT